MRIHSTLLEKYSNYGDYYLVSPSSTVFVYGKKYRHEDLVIRSNQNFNQNQFLLFNLDGQMEVSESDIESLFNRTIKKLKSTPIESFNLDKKYIEAIGDTINSTDSTHIRFYTDSLGLKVSVFNYRQFITRINIRPLGIPFISESVIQNSEFTGDINFSIDARTFLKLPDHNYEVEVMENGLVNFINLEHELEFFIREQELQEPLTKFTNEKLDLETVFLFQPTIT